MSAIGPSLPPHLLAKRKRQREESVQDESATTSGAKRAKSQSPPPDTEDSQDGNRSKGIGLAAPPVIGPTPPPAPLDQRPTSPVAAEDDSSDDDDDFGPAPPTAADLQRTDDQDSNRPLLSDLDKQPTRAQRDEWMMVPPTADDLSARMDPTKLRARGFNTGKSATAGPSGGMDAAWTETREEKLKRLQNEAMGVKGSSATDFDKRRSAKSQERDEQAKKIREHTEKTRGPSLIEQHRKVQKVEDDDPSKRAFDREKDIGGGGVNRVQRNDMLKKAGDFSSKFSGGNYL